MSNDRVRYMLNYVIYPIKLVKYQIQQLTKSHWYEREKRKPRKPYIGERILYRYMIRWSTERKHLFLRKMGL